jgi:hypothetical protein
MTATTAPPVRNRALWIATACVCGVVALVALLPLGAEIASAFSGDHIWSLESLEYAVLPIAAIAVSWALAWSIRRAASPGSAILRAVLAVCIAIAGCAPLVVLFATLLAQEFPTSAP